MQVVSSKFYSTTFDPSTGYSKFYWYDSGNNQWKQIKKVNNSNFTAIDYFSSNQAYAADNEGRLYFNANVSGTSSHWIHQYSNLNHKIIDLRFFDQQDGVAIVGGKIYRTNDDGKNWTALSLNGHFNTLANSDDHPTIIAGGNDGKLVLLFPYQSGNIANQFMDITTHPYVNDISAVWISQLISGKRAVLFADQDTLWFTNNVLVSSTSINWQKQSYSSQTSGNAIHSLAAELQSSGELYGVAVTVGNRAWRLTGNTNSYVSLVGQFTGINPNFYTVAKGPSSFYLSSITNSVAKADFSNSIQTLDIGVLPFAVRHLGVQQDQLIVSDGTTGKIGSLQLTSGGTAIANTDEQTQKIYPDMINTLAIDKTTNELFALGDDGLIYHYNTGNSSFDRLNCSLNANIYGADINNTIAYVVGQNGLAKRGLIISSSATFTDLMTYASNTVESAALQLYCCAYIKKQLITNQ